MDNLNSYRTRTIKAILQKLDALDSDLQAWDYQLDDLARKIFNLSPRLDFGQNPKEFAKFIGEQSPIRRGQRNEKIDRSFDKLISIDS